LSTALVAGGAGFLGSHLCELLLARGHRVVCVDDLATGAADNIREISDGRFRFLRHDVTRPLRYRGRLDLVFHLASPASPTDYARLPIETLMAGSVGTHRLLELAAAKGARFLLASTSEVYGDPLVAPQPESYWGNVNPVGPRSVYDEAKRYAEALTAAYRRAGRVDSGIARIFNTYGPRMRRDDGRAVPTLVSQALRGEALTIFGDGLQTRSFCYVDDTIDGLYALARSSEGSPVNLGNPEEITLLELAQRILALTGADGPIVHLPAPVDDPRRRQPVITRAREVLGWEPRVGLREGLTRFIDWARSAYAPTSPSTAADRPFRA
jgi:dTDP-glucose 4,6-dehydratase